jgi:hypothetical protein
MSLKDVFGRHRQPTLLTPYTLLSIFHHSSPNTAMVYSWANSKKTYKLIEYFLGTIGTKIVQ